MKLSTATLLLIGSTQGAQIQSRSLVQSSLVGLETPVFLPQAPPAQNASNNSQSATPEGNSLISVDEAKFNKQNKKTTLTIV